MRSTIVVFGSFVVDLAARSCGLPLPGQTLPGNSFRMGPGGKGSNQAVAVHRAGADVALVTKIGKDVFGDIAMDFYRKENMNTGYILTDDVKETGIALITVDEATGQNEIVVVSGACGHITPDDIEKCRPLIENAGILLLQHEINADAQREVIEIAHAANVRIVLNPAPAREIPADLIAKIDTVTPNETEAEALTGVKVVDYVSARDAAKVFFEKGVKNVVITMGASGAFASDGVRSELIPCLPVHAVDTTGAGDAFNGGFVTALSEGKDLFEALRFGNAAGALSVTRYGTAPAMPTRGEIDGLFNINYGKAARI